MKKSIAYILLSVFTLFFIALFVYTLDPKLDLNGDNAIYIQLARNMADGLGYSNVSTSGVASPASHFPPGYSAVLSAAMFLGVNSLMGFKILNGIFLFLSLVLLGFMMSKITRQGYLVFSMAILTVLCPILMHFAGIVMSEMSYMFFVMLSLFALFRYGGGSGRFAFVRSPWFYLSIVSAVAAYHIRTVGASVMFAVVVFYLFRREWLAAAGSAVGMGLLMLPWMIRNSVCGVKSRYMDTIMVVNPWRPEEGNIGSVGELFGKMLQNFDETVIKGFKEILFPFVQVDYGQTSGVMAVAGGVAILAVVLVGAWNSGKLGPALTAFIIANIGLFALWHGGNGARYVTPIAPMLYFCFYYGVFVVIRIAVKDRVPDNTPYLLLLLLLALPMIPPVQRQHKIAMQPYPVQYQQYFAVAEEIQRQAPAGTVVCCRKPELFKFYAPDIYTTNYLYTADADELLQNLVDKNVDYVVLDNLGYSSTPRYLLPAINNRSGYFSTVWHLQNPDMYVLKFDRKGYAADRFEK